MARAGRCRPTGADPSFDRAPPVAVRRDREPLVAQPQAARPTTGLHEPLAVIGGTRPHLGVGALLEIRRNVGLPCEIEFDRRPFVLVGPYVDGPGPREDFNTQRTGPGDGAVAIEDDGAAQRVLHPVPHGDGIGIDEPAVRVLAQPDDHEQVVAVRVQIEVEAFEEVRIRGRHRGQQLRGLVNGVVVHGGHMPPLISHCVMVSGIALDGPLRRESNLGSVMTSLPSGPRKVLPPVPGQEDLDPDAFLVIHALCVKQVATVSELAAMTSMEQETLERQLALLEHAGEAVLRARHQLWQLTPDGAARHKHRLADDAKRNPGADQLRQAYDDFLPLDVALKEQCGEWQLRQGKPNEHDDVAYDAGVIEGLGEIDQKVGIALAAMTTALPRLGRYRPRLEAAYDRVRQGDGDAFTGVSCGSYHDIWMELHQDLLLTLGIDRLAEGSV